MANNPFEHVITEATSKAKAGMRPGDFTGDDGLIHCGKCGEPREEVIDLPEFLHARKGKTAKVSRECLCERTEREERETAEQERIRAERIERNRRDCFEFESEKAMTFDNDDMSNPRITKACRRFVDRFDTALREGAGLLFFGAVGGGKSYHAAEIANGVIDKGYRALFTSIARLSARVGFDSDKAKLLAYLRTFDLVVLDDLGTERSTEAANEKAFFIVDSLGMLAKEDRNGGHPTVTIFTTNLDPKAMVEERDSNLQKIYSRAIGMSQMVEVKHADRRKVKSPGAADFYKGLFEED